MRYHIAITAIFCCFTFSALGQSNYGVKGLVTDTTSKAALNDATITVLNAKDSILQKFTYSSKGAFTISNLKPGNFLLLVTYGDYADYAANFTLDAAHPIHTFKNIGMIERAKLLNEVMIKGRAAEVKIKGDTSIFNAAAFATQKNAKADDLLKQLPGMTVDQNGTITFQGETVKKILVDGDEFFGDDPVLVSRTVRADMVAQIKVYNDKSEAAKLTGIEDGVKIKTINLQLRDDKKNGVFGKVEGDAGTGKYYTGQAMFNKFSPKEKISVYGNLSNTGKVGLSNADNSRFGSGTNTMIIGSNGTVTANGTYGGIGIPIARDGGVHYDSKWNNNKSSINANYKTGSLDINNTGSTMIRNNLPGSDYNTTNSNNISHNYDFTQSADLNLLTQIDTSSSLTTIVRAFDRHGDDEDTETTKTLRGNGVLLNTNDNAVTSNNKNRSGTLTLNYIKRLKKKGRSISLSGTAFRSESTIDEYLKSNPSYYDTQGNFINSSPVDQYKPTNSNSNILGIGFTYTEPLSTALSLSAGYRIEQNINNNSRLSYNKSPANVYDQLDNQFSSDFETNASTNNYTLSLAYRTEKTTFGLGSTVANVRFKQTDKLIDTALTRNFINWSPSANFRYQLSRAASFGVNYYGFTTQPGIYQIQPIKQNSDPLNITLGNSGLKPQFRNTISLSYNVYRNSSVSGLDFSLNYSTIVNAIIQNRTTDSAGVNTYQYVNLKGKQPSNWRAYLGAYGSVTNAEISLRPAININGSTYYNYVNGKINETRSVSYNPGIGISKSRPDYSYFFDFGLNYTINNSSLQQVNNNSHGYISHLNLFTKLPLNFYIGTENSYEFTAKNLVFANDYHRLLTKAYFGKNFLADESLKIAITGNDIFNQNTGYYRSGNFDRFTETRNNTISRYFMLAVSWDFSKFSKPAQTKK